MIARAKPVFRRRNGPRVGLEFSYVRPIVRLFDCTRSSLASGFLFIDPVRKTPTRVSHNIDSTKMLVAKENARKEGFWSEITRDVYLKRVCVTPRRRTFGGGGDSGTAN